MDESPSTLSKSFVSIDATDQPPPTLREGCEAYPGRSPNHGGRVLTDLLSDDDDNGGNLVDGGSGGNNNPVVTLNEAEDDDAPTPPPPPPIAPGVIPDDDPSIE